jgi:hypothetical protein
VDGRQNNGAKRGNQNARGPHLRRDRGPSAPGPREKAALLRADRKLSRLTEIAVAVLERILKSPDSTHMDLQAAARDVLDRKIPKKTQTDVTLEGAPIVMLRIPGLNWPGMEAEPELPAAIAARNGHTRGARGA